MMLLFLQEFSKPRPASFEGSTMRLQPFAVGL